MEGNLTVDDTILADDSNGLKFATDDGTVRMTLDDSGSVGIGITSPNAKLHVNGDIILDDTLQAEDSGGIKFASDDGTTRMIVKDGGFVGIGTTSPSAQLHVNGDIYTEGNIRGHAFFAKNNFGVRMLTDDGYPRLVIVDSGTVGIGTVTPNDHQLSVEGDESGASGATGLFKNTHSSGIAMSLQNDSSDCTLLINNGGSGNIMNCDSDNGGWHRVFAMKNDGSIGVRTSSFSGALYVNGSAGGSSAWNSDSDKRLKTKVHLIKNPLDKVLAMEGVSFEWLDDSRDAPGRRIGFIGQDVEKILPEVVSVTDDHYSMQYAPVTALLVEAVKEQHEIIENQQLQIDELKAMVRALGMQIENSNALQVPKHP